ncbi:phosphate regulon transcriptional regulatory protein PhoB (plasmid) [Sinorhizobium americanum CCGM7]|uniref:winged helix-turn-helix transcriptional regulator n=1 Tax=Sinorhizobium americanum TaxID=194963 RepID=UPI0004D854CB|nr:response regulator transcription factor [Sinorhizobium americanum]APG88117.1 phosphate regulon transcriptional regulatory protein PhoB [Sinorhizobium americanum CCGM7]
MNVQHKKPSILICSDDANFYVMLAYILAREGFQTTLVSESEVADQATIRPVTAIILIAAEDSGPMLRACAAIKGSDTTAHIPTIAVVSSGDYLALLKAGADENFVRPISPARLLAYLGSLPKDDANDVRLPDADEEARTFGPLSIDPGRRIVRYGGQETRFGPIEFNLLRCFLKAPGRVCRRSELIEAAWPSDHYVQPRTVDVHVGRLRRSLERLTGRTLIRTVRAAGYAMEVDERSG